MNKVKKINNPLLNYENQWVALASDGKEVIASGGSIKEVDKKLTKEERKYIILTKVLPFDKTLAP